MKERGERGNRREVREKRKQPILHSCFVAGHDMANFIKGRSNPKDSDVLQETPKPTVYPSWESLTDTLLVRVAEMTKQCSGALHHTFQKTS